MSRYQGTILPSGLEDKKTETETRKAILDLLKKINEVYEECRPSAFSFIEDYRSTSGGTRTETLLPLEINQTSFVLWQIKRSSGTITVALPSEGTYQVALFQGYTTSTTDVFTTTTNVSSSASMGTIAGGSTVTLNASGSQTAGSIFGWVKRIA